MAKAAALKGAQPRNSLDAADQWEMVRRSETPSLPTAAGYGSKTSVAVAQVFQFIIANIFSS